MIKPIARFRTRKQAQSAAPVIAGYDIKVVSTVLPTNDPYLWQRYWIVEYHSQQDTTYWSELRIDGTITN